jgi:hypothetical protein
MASKGWTWTSQRCGRYDYQKVLVHTTNPDHLMPSTPSLTPAGRITPAETKQIDRDETEESWPFPN